MFSTAAKNLMLDALDESVGTGAKFWSTHSAYSTTGTNESTGGSPAYARKAATWAAASGGSKASTGGATFDQAPGSTVAWIGRWDAVTVGTFLGMGPAGGGARRQFNISDSADITANTIDSPAHGLVAGNQVVFWVGAGAGLPSPLAEGTIYFVIATGLTTDVFEVSLTLGGSAVDLTTGGSGMFQSIVPEVFSGQGTYALTGDTMSQI
jgi:hypothetical protein